MYKAVSFEITFSESGLTGTFSTWKAVNKALWGIVYKYPDVGMGGFKTDVTVTFDDGETYEARLCIDRKGSDTDLGQHIRQHCEFYGGRYCPPHLTLEQYSEFLRTATTEEDRIKHNWFLQNYSLTD